MKKTIGVIVILLSVFILLVIGGAIGIRFIKQGVLKKQLESSKDPAIFAFIKYFLVDKKADSRSQGREVSAQMMKAFEYLKEDKNEEALALFNAILATHRESRAISAVAQLFKGISYIRMAKVDFVGIDVSISKNEVTREQVREGIKALEVVLSEYQDFPQCGAQALYEMGAGYYYSLDEKEKGKESWQRLIDSYPESAFATLAKFELGQITDEALIELAGTPDFFSKEEVFSIIAAKYQKQGNLEKAAEYFKKVILTSLNPEAIVYVRARKQLQRIEEQMK